MAKIKGESENEGLRKSSSITNKLEYFGAT